MKRYLLYLWLPMQLAILSTQANTQSLSFIEKYAGLDALFIGVALYQMVSIPAELEEDEPAVFFWDNGGQLYSEPDISELPPCLISKKTTDIEGLIEHETSLSSPPLEPTENHSLLDGSAYTVRKCNDEDESSDEESESSDEGSESSITDSDSCTAMEVSSEEVMPHLVRELYESTILHLNDRILVQDIAGIKLILEKQKNVHSELNSMYTAGIKLILEKQKSIHSDFNPMYTALKTLNPDIFRMLLNAGFDPNLACAHMDSPIAYLVRRHRFGVPHNTAAPLAPEKAGPCVQQFLNRNTDWLMLRVEPSETFLFRPYLPLRSPFYYLLQCSWEKHDYLREAVLKEIEAQGYGFKHPRLDQLTFELATSSVFSCAVLRWALKCGASTEADGIVGVVAPKAKQLRLLIRYIYWRWGSLKGSAVQYSSSPVEKAADKALVLLEAGADCLELPDIDPMPLLMIILMEPKRPYHDIYSSIPTLKEFYFLRLRHQALLQLEKKGIDLNSEYLGEKTFLELLEEHQSQIASGTFIQLYFYGVQLNGAIPSSSLEEIKQKLKNEYSTNLQLRSLHEALKAVMTWQALFSLPCSQIVIRQCLKKLF